MVGVRLWDLDEHAPLKELIIVLQGILFEIMLMSSQFQKQEEEQPVCKGMDHVLTIVDTHFSRLKGGTC